MSLYRASGLPGLQRLR